MQDLLGALGPDRPAAICREMTKLHEEVLRGTLAELAGMFKERPVKGECVIVVAGVGQAKFNRSSANGNEPA
jgi:16S rRNA (cytidine1402-2'-O)-methyltransferase